MTEFIRSAPEFELVSAIKRATNQGHELKAAQQISGASGQLNYTGQSSNEWDIIQTLSSPGGWSNMVLTATMTGDGTQDWFEAQAYLDFRANGTNESNRLEYFDGTYGGTTFERALGWTDGTNTITHIGTNRTYESGPRKFTWDMGFYYRGTITYYTKLVLRTTCLGEATFGRTI